MLKTIKEFLTNFLEGSAVIKEYFLSFNKANLQLLNCDQIKAINSLIHFSRKEI